MDNLDEFETVERGDLVVRLHPDEAPILREYVLDIAQEALDELSARYDMTVQTPVLVEVFPNHDDFAVRTLGLPGMIGALGACFGQVVTLDSPRARPPGDFNWMSTLWHEIAHVITLQMSSQRLPRWLSEGISTYEEKRKHLAWGRDQVLEFANALNSGTLLSISELDRGFTRPRVDIALLLSRLGGGRAPDRSLRSGVPQDPDSRVRRRAGDRGGPRPHRSRLRAPPGELRRGGGGAVRRAAALAAEQAAEPAGGSGASRGAAEAGGGTAGQLQRAVRARPGVARSRRYRGRPRCLRACGRAGAHGDGPGKPARAVGESGGCGGRRRARDGGAGTPARVRRDVDRRRPQVRRAGGGRGRRRPVAGGLRAADRDRPVRSDPAPDAWPDRQGRRADRGPRCGSWRWRLPSGPVDRVAAHTDLAETLFAAGRLAEARRQTLSALEIAPTYDRALELLLSIVEVDR